MFYTIAEKKRLVHNFIFYLDTLSNTDKNTVVQLRNPFELDGSISNEGDLFIAKFCYKYTYDIQRLSKWDQFALVYLASLKYSYKHIELSSQPFETIFTNLKDEHLSHTLEEKIKLLFTNRYSNYELNTTQKRFNASFESLFKYINQKRLSVNWSSFLDHLFLYPLNHEIQKKWRRAYYKI